MCEYNPKNDSRKLDPCLANLIGRLKKQGLNTVGCCCGHFKYHLTIVCENSEGGRFDFITGVYIPRRKKSYKKDKEGIYFIPEVEEFWKKNQKEVQL